MSESDVEDHVVAAEEEGSDDGQEELSADEVQPTLDDEDSPVSSADALSNDDDEITP